MRVFFWSGSEESTAKLKTLQGEFDIVQIRYGWDKEKVQRADQVIKDYRLKVFSYPPMDKVGDKWRFAVGTQFIDIPLDGEPDKRMNFSPMDWTELLN